MKDTALYEQLLGSKTAWSVKKVDLSLADQRVLAEVVLKKGGAGVCEPNGCHQESPHQWLE